MKFETVHDGTDTLEVRFADDEEFTVQAAVSTVGHAGYSRVWFFNHAGELYTITAAVVAG